MMGQTKAVGNCLNYDIMTSLLITVLLHCRYKRWKIIQLYWPLQNQETFWGWGKFIGFVP